MTRLSSLPSLVLPPALLALVLSACVATGAAGPSPAVGEARPLAVAPATSGACASVAAAYCEALARCNPHWLAIDFPNQTSCAERMALGCARSASASGSGGLVTDLDPCLTPLASGCEALVPGTLPTCAFVPGTAAPGAACEVDGQCTSLRCVIGKDGCGVCAKSPATAKPCENGPRKDEGRRVGATCKDGACAHALGLQCETSTTRCAAIPLRAAGESCDMTGVMSGRLSECADGHCKNRNDMGAGTCAAFADDGAACDSWEGPPCRAPARCIAGRCRVPPVVCAPR